jgi:hypothetical protein
MDPLLVAECGRRAMVPVTSIRSIACEIQLQDRAASAYFLRLIARGRLE